MDGIRVGFYWEGLPPYVLDWAAELLPQGTIAVETGTFRGDTSALLADFFGNCVTIERSPEFVAHAHIRFKEDLRVSVLEGSSRDRLADALPLADVPIFVWLDAHGIYNFADTEAEENPLLEELQIIISSRRQSHIVIAIDDARGMGTQPGWPTLGEVSSLLHEAGFTTVVIDDCVIAVPAILNPDFWALYSRSRTVEVAALFHVWDSVTRSVRIRRRLDALMGKFRN